MAGKWCRVTVTDPGGRRHGIDVQATSSYDAAHLYVTHAKGQSAAQCPVPTLATVFEIHVEGKVYRVEGKALQSWIEKRRQEWKGPKLNKLRHAGILFVKPSIGIFQFAMVVDVSQF